MHIETEYINEKEKVNLSFDTLAFSEKRTPQPEGVEPRKNFTISFC